jgi:hypothetical protein
MYVCVCISMYVRMCMHKYVCMHTTNLYTHTCSIDVHMYICMYAYVARILMYTRTYAGRSCRVVILGSGVSSRLNQDTHPGDVHFPICVYIASINVFVCVCVYHMGQRRVEVMDHEC